MNSIKTTPQRFSVALVIFATLLLAVPVFAQNPRSRIFPDLVVPATCGMQLKGPYSTPADLDQMKALGVKVVRRGFHWERLEKNKGAYDFSADDEVMRGLRARDLRVIGVIAFANKLHGPVRQAEGRAAYARYAAALAAHYKADRVIWELWNEPNTMTFWGRHGKKGNTEPYAEEYVALVKEVVPAMRRADPDCIIVAGSVSCLWSESYKWIDFCFARGILQTGIDGWSVHPYSPNLPEDYIAAYDKVRDMMEKYGARRDFIMLNTERGFPIRRAEGHAGGEAAKQREYQAWHLVRQYLIDLMCGMRSTVWYEWKNAREGFGIFDGDKASPAYRACQVTLEQLRGYRLEQRVPTDSPRDFVLDFRGPSGARTLVAWTAPPTGGTPDKAAPHPIELAVQGDGLLKLVRLDGGIGTAAAKNGRVTLNLSGAPQFLHVRGGE